MHLSEIDRAFAGNQELRKRVHAAIDEHPAHSTLFRDISTYIINNTNQTTLVNGEPALKKRKLEESNGGQRGSAGAGSLADPSFAAWRSYPNTSFSIPQRKKLTLELILGKGGDGGIRGIGASKAVEFAIAWKDVDQIFCLPIPEKAKRQHNFIVIPLHGDGINPAPVGSAPPEPIVWTFEEATGKNIVEGEDPGPGPMAEAIHHCLLQAKTGKTVIFPEENDFSSAIVQSHRKGEKAYHVKAYKGSKDGFLFFTSVGIFWGFKKPLLYFSFNNINSISYTAVLRNTFNLNITTHDPTDPSKTQEFEFGMLDQADYAGIDAYVKEHELQDASLAEQRRAKKLNVNPPEETEAGAAGHGDGGEDGETELQRAERLLQDQEDEEEEDYDPGSEGESEGSGTSDEEDEDGEGYGEEYDEEEEYPEGEEGGEIDDHAEEW
ncbi:Rtt106-domain-containing protein [Delitschia confertaspora ATCC 74209]|uniref:Rtt106-domain-containing protein n=1 Tax=Delitschia confertaspora ATCC 74209 TaxID=1513339 RepID=A0A9P4JTQ1_9PLEO|nr:Rtt106-domain-containing protein [Delitschia confertaspora ATCC 74209]